MHGLSTPFTLESGLSFMVWCARICLLSSLDPGQPETRHLDPGMTTALGEKYRDFCEWYDVEAQVFDLYNDWVDEGIAEPSIRDDPPPTRTTTEA
ncbi:hypothetical protein AcW1_009160 [Taiwanofungus camphoratus]|nr:hypothetical protein AcV5_007182 [Antrodia cinnamomea]KAI0949601.1 hypothetical protein AcW1_009160 [Antrodia cinnamomea]KAI0958577.1 hypothetical protein AcV7_004364 [Antrodia cinnamomea]